MSAQGARNATDDGTERRQAEGTCARGSRDGPQTPACRDHCHRASLSRAGAAKTTSSVAANVEAGIESDKADVGRRAKGGLRSHETLLGGTSRGESQNQMKRADVAVQERSSDAGASMIRCQVQVRIPPSRPFTSEPGTSRPAPWDPWRRRLAKPG